MRLVYLYNEILPKKKAHDVYIFSECTELAKNGLSVHLLCGKQSLPDKLLFQHYEREKAENLQIERLPIVRKNNFLNISWNLPFFITCQRRIKAIRPDWVILSVRKQAAFHLKRKVRGVKYLYEVHELSFYPNQPPQKDLALEKDMLSRADLITVTTEALKNILLSPPYSLKVPIFAVPLAVRPLNLPKKEPRFPLILAYVGQLYQGQGVELLLKAVRQVENVQVKLIGGSEQDCKRLIHLSKELGVDAKVAFLGFQPPSKLESLLQDAHAFVAPFQNEGRMPFVAHTKLYEYASSFKPFIAPKLPIVEEHFSEGKGVLFFEPNNEHSLAQAIQRLHDRDQYRLLVEKASFFENSFTWEKRIERYKELFSFFI